MTTIPTIGDDLLWLAQPTEDRYQTEGRDDTAVFVPARVDGFDPRGRVRIIVRTIAGRRQEKYVHLSRLAGRTRAGEANQEATE